MITPVTAAEMKQIEYNAFQHGTSYLTMMERAGCGAAEEISKMISVEKIILILTGKGNNGGDGYVVARHLKEKGYQVMVLVAEGLPATSEAKKNFSLCQERGIELYQYEPGAGDLLIQGADLIVDAIYGAGFHGNLAEPISSMFREINRSKCRVVALDLPSGLHADTGISSKNTLSAETTLVFARYKQAHFTENGLSLCGRIQLIDIGI